MKKLTAILLAAIVLCAPATKSFSWGDHYRYRDGHYFRDAGWWGLGGFVSGLAVGAYVASLPPQYETVYIDGAPYYYADGYYYQAGPNGYVVVQPPASEAQVPPSANNPMMMILGILLAIILLLCVGLLLKKLLVRQGKPA